VRNIFIPAADSCGYVARIIDHGRTRVDRPGNWGDTQSAAHVFVDGCAPSPAFDAAIDTRSLAHDLILSALSTWTPVLAAAASGARSAAAAPSPLPPSPRLRARSGGAAATGIEPLWGKEDDADDAARAGQVLLHRQICDFVDVIEAMTGVRTWMGWRSKPDISRGDPRVVPRSFFQYAVWATTRVVSKTSVDAIRCNEFIIRRPEANPAGAPAAVLEMPFFATYHAPPSSSAAVHNVADFTRVPNLQRSRMREFIVPHPSFPHDDRVAPEPPRGSPVARGDTPPARRRLPKRARCGIQSAK
jgi:hypothetical protein